MDVREFISFLSDLIIVWYFRDFRGRPQLFWSKFCSGARVFVMPWFGWGYGFTTFCRKGHDGYGGDFLRGVTFIWWSEGLFRVVFYGPGCSKNFGVSRCLPRKGLVSRRRGVGVLRSLGVLRSTGGDRGVLRTGTYIYSDDRGLVISLTNVGNVVPERRNTVKVGSNSIHSVTIVSEIGHPIYFIIASVARSRGNGPVMVLSHRGTRHGYLSTCVSELQYKSVIPTHVARLRGFNTFTSVNYKVITLVPVSAVSISEVRRPTREFAMKVSVGTIVGSIRGNHVDLDRGRLLNA